MKGLTEKMLRNNLLIVFYDLDEDEFVLGGVEFHIGFKYKDPDLETIKTMTFTHKGEVINDKNYIFLGFL